MPVDLKGKCIIVTGGATGIGRATALRVSAYGAKVAIFDVNAGEGANTVNDINELGGKPGPFAPSSNRNHPNRY